VLMDRKSMLAPGGQTLSFNQENEEEMLPLEAHCFTCIGKH
jgi:hypothetical protein